MSDDTETDEVIDDREGRRFVILGSGERPAELVYRINGERMLIVHTYVPDADRGRGVAGRLMEAAVDQAGSEGLTIVPVCPYARYWLTAHPEEASDLTIDWKAYSSRT